MLESSGEVIYCLSTYADWWQPASASVLAVGAARRGSEISDGIHPGLLETLETRAELARRMRYLTERDRRILLLWYVRQARVEEIAREMGISRRQCFRRRAKAIQALIDLGSATTPSTMPIPSATPA
jgi:DNA-directed RNA polymerase specialized sigma24 family protein